VAGTFAAIQSEGWLATRSSLRFRRAKGGGPDRDRTGDLMNAMLRKPCSTDHDLENWAVIVRNCFTYRATILGGPPIFAEVLHGAFQGPQTVAEIEETDAGAISQLKQPAVVRDRLASGSGSTSASTVLRELRINVGVSSFKANPRRTTSLTTLRTSRSNAA
jgi:hypothetical protein